MNKLQLIILFLLSVVFSHAQNNWDKQIDAKMPEVLTSHRDFVRIPNLPVDIQKMYENISWVKNRYEQVGFELKNLKSSTLPVLFAERIVNPELKTILFYFHLDGQHTDPEAWDQEDPFTPVLKNKQKMEIGIPLAGNISTTRLTKNGESLPELQQMTKHQ